MVSRYHLVYAARELKNRKARYAVSIFGIAAATALLISLSALSSAYREAARVPLEEVGADFVVQKYGRVPKVVAGPILSCAVGPISQREIDRIRQLEGVQEISPVLLIWVFDRDYFKIVTGIRPDSSMGELMAAMIEEGEFISDRSRTAVVEKNFARMYGIKLNDTVKIDANNYTVIGILAAQRKDRIGATNILIPMNDAQEMAYNSWNIQNTVPFRRTDVNMLFLKVDQDKIPQVKSKIEGILGRNSRTASMDSFLPQVASVMGVTNSFSTVTSLMAVVVAALLVFKTTAGGILQRKSEIGLMKAVGWTEKDVKTQVLVESSLLDVVGGMAGIVLGWTVIYMLGMVDISIPVPQDLTPNPFLASDTQIQVRLPVEFSLPVSLLSLGLVGISGMLAGILASRKISILKPVEVLKYE